MKTVIIGAGLSGLLIAKKLLSNKKLNDEILIIEKGKSIIDRIINLDHCKNDLSPYGEGGKIFFNFKPFLIEENSYDKRLIDLLKEYKLYKKNRIIDAHIILSLIKSLHFELFNKVDIIYENPIVNFFSKNSKLGGVILKSGDTIDGDNFIFSFGLLDKSLYHSLWNNNVALKSLSTFIPLKISVSLDSIEEFNKLNSFIKSKPLISFDKRISFIDEYQKNTCIVSVNSSKELISYENFILKKEFKNSLVNFNLNISIAESELSGFKNSSLKNMELLSLIEKNQYEINLQRAVSYYEFLGDNIFDMILSNSLSDFFKKSIANMFKNFDNSFKSRINIHGVSTISLRPIQIITDSQGRSITYPNALIIGSAKNNFSGLKNKIIDILDSI